MNSSPVPQIAVVDDFLDGDECKSLITIVDRLAASSYRDGIRRTVHRTEISARNARVLSKTAYDLIGAARLRIIEVITDRFDVEQPLYPEYTVLSAMRVGDRHTRHADRERRTADGGWEPNHTPYRDYTGIVYLNTQGSQFSGGLLLFPGLGREIRPRSGQLVAFGCDRRYEHEVTPVGAGARYSMSSWFTSFPARAEKWEA
jgi:2OG-Fe(II) oxygenase superfamily